MTALWRSCSTFIRWGNPGGDPRNIVRVALPRRSPPAYFPHAAYYYLGIKQPGVADDQLKNSLNALDEARNFAFKSVAPIALCVQRYVSHNGDDGEASDWIADVARCFARSKKYRVNRRPSAKTTCRTSRGRRCGR